MKKQKRFQSQRIWMVVVFFLVSIYAMNGCDTTQPSTFPNQQVTELHTESNTNTETDLPTDDEHENIPEEPTTETVEPIDVEQPSDTSSTTEEVDAFEHPIDDESYVYLGKTYHIIEMDGGDLSGDRQSNVAVNIGFGNREYWALTNEYGQLVYVLAEHIVLQDDETEPVKSNGRYYWDEAKVPGVEREDLDEGHIIADSLGGVSNAYNITPQNSTLNRYGDQAYMERVIRDAGGCEHFLAVITYATTTTQIPSRYKYEYSLHGQTIVDEFDNVDPDQVNASLNTSKAQTEQSDSNASTNTNTDVNENEELLKIDTNRNGKVTIAEAKAAGYPMPITSDHWLYKYMDDRDGDGMVGE